MNVPILVAASVSERFSVRSLHEPTRSELRGIGHNLDESIVQRVAASGPALAHFGTIEFASLYQN